MNFKYIKTTLIVGALAFSGSLFAESNEYKKYRYNNEYDLRLNQEKEENRKREKNYRKEQNRNREENRKREENHRKEQNRNREENRKREENRRKEQNRNREEYRISESEINIQKEKDDPSINRWWWPFSFFGE